VGVFAFIATILMGGIIGGVVFLIYGQQINTIFNAPLPTPTFPPPPTHTLTSTPTITSTATLTPTLTITYTPSPSETFTPTFTPSITDTLTDTPLHAPTETAGPVSGSTVLALLATANYYHLEGKMTFLSNDSSSNMVETVTQDWDKKSNASHTFLTLYEQDYPSSKMTFEVIIIDKAVWIRYDDSPWDKQVYSKTQNMGDVVDDLIGYLQKLYLVGTETTNGVACKHYTIDTDVIKMTGQAQGSVSHVKGEVWAAENSSLPHVIVKMNLAYRIVGGLASNMPLPKRFPTPAFTTQTQTGDSDADFEFSATKINVPISIVPPK
jgi:hypothetical protein